MPKLSDLKHTPTKVILYAKPGNGKSVLLATLGELLQLYDLDGGLKSAQSLKDSFTATRGNVDVVTVEEPMPLKQAIAFPQFKAKILQVLNECQSKKYPFKVLGIDSFTSLADAAKRYTMQNAGGIEKKMEIQHWGTMFGELENIMLILKAMPIPVVVLFHEMEYEGNDEKYHTKLAIQGKALPPKIPALVHELWHLEVQPGIGSAPSKYVIRTKATDTIDAKSRSQIPDLTDTSVGMRKLLEMCGERFES